MTAAPEWNGMPLAEAAADEMSLHSAIAAVVGERAFAFLNESAGLVAVHERACRMAFLADRSGPEVEVIRRAMIYLDKNGRYEFYDRAGEPAAPTP